MIEKIKTLMWFLARPSYWAQARELGIRKLRTDYDGSNSARSARDWAAEHAVPISEALAAIRLLPTRDHDIPALPKALISEAHALAEESKASMGGPGDIDLIYAATVLSDSERVVETGVAYGWSSLAIVAALNEIDGGKLVSVDMPYPKMNNEAFVGIVVPEKLREKWVLIREPDRNGLRKAIAYFDGEIDLCHYDSDKSYWGRQFGYNLMWNALKSGGVFITDDIQDNLAFKEFVAAKKVNFAVTEYQQKFVGILRKS